jgi:outer membrane protein, heavy metal efflux system
MRYFAFSLFMLCVLNLSAQKDTILTLKGSESLFLANNLELLAARFNVDSAQAAIIQARTWENPNLQVGMNLYNPENQKYFDIGNEGQKSAGFDQLIYLGGKKRNEVAMARTNAEFAELQFADLLRNLKQVLRQNYFNLYYDNLSFQSIRKQLNNLDSLVLSYRIQVEKGNIPMKDLVRLQSLQLTFKNQEAQLYETIVDCQHTLGLITGLKVTITPEPSDNELIIYQENRVLNTDSLSQIALANRTDLKMAQKQISISNLNVKWQKSMAIPDLTIGAIWDQQGGAFKNEVGLNLGIPLPLWNRNQGNIKIARAQLNEATVRQTYLTNSVISEVDKSVRKWKEAVDNYRFMDKQSLQNLEDVQKGIFTNFKNGNLSLIEFTDFMESYHSTLTQYYQFGQNLVSACEQINFVTNSKIF